MFVKIRDMAKYDLNAVAIVEKGVFSSPWPLAAYESEIKKPTSICKVAACGDYIIGYMCVSTILDEAHLMKLAVHENFRRKGVARLLVTEVLDILHDKFSGILLLEVRPSNLPALKLYEKFGFNKLYVRKRYYVTPDEDALVMGLNINRVTPFKDHEPISSPLTF
ncbi:MAG: ribosomal protein S18-alanine N-acetyltransferase [Nitrospirae bacterium]|nr:ribosomal protein S18-alanine N-acetyltransferase [Nitrospirota bacterium]